METTQANAPRSNPLKFTIPLYFMQALPVFLTGETAVLMFKDLGMVEADITKWAALIGLPYGIKLFWAPLIELNRTRRFWILLFQLLIGLAMIALAFIAAIPSATNLMLVIMGFMAFAGATCDIATDGFYIAAVPKEDQPKYVGFNSTFFRAGRLFATGFIPIVAGLLQRSTTWSKPLTWAVAIGATAGIYFALRAYLQLALPKVASDVPPETSQPINNRSTLTNVALLLVAALGTYFALSSVLKLVLNAVWAALDGKVDGPFKGWMLAREASIINVFTGSGVGLELNQLIVASVAAALSWLTLRRTMRGTELAEAFGTFLKQPGIVMILGFVLTYRFGEAMLGILSGPFLQAARAEGGYGLPVEVVGTINGTVGVIGIIVGGIVGGAFVAKVGLRRAFPYLAAAMIIPNALYYLVSITFPALWTIYGLAFLDQFGYGFGFAGYMVYLMYVAQRGKFPTSHYAIGTALGALCIALAKAIGGVIHANYGYPGFFLATVVLAVPGVLILRLVPLDETEGKGITPVESAD